MSNPTPNNQESIYTELETEIQNTLITRFNKQESYTRIGDKVLLSLCTPPTNTPSNEAKLKEYCNFHKSFSLGEPGTPGSKNYTLSPHVYDLIGSAWTHLNRLNEDQIVFLIGESTTGKSATSKLLTSSLIQLSKPLHKKKTKTQSLIGRIDPILSIIGSCSATNSLISPSKFGKFIEYQFSSNASMIGCKLVDFLFDVNKIVTNQPYYHNATDNGFAGNFKIFQCLVHGITDVIESKQLKLLDDIKHYKLLNPGGNHTILNGLTDYAQKKRDVEEMKGFRENLKSFGIGSSQQLSIFSFLSGILLLGNLEFVPNDKAKTAESCSLKYPEQILDIAELLGLNHIQLTNTLLNKTCWINNATCSVILDVDRAALQRDEIIKNCYTLFWKWFIDMFNDKLCVLEGVEKRVGVVEFPGFISTKNLTNNYHNTSSNSILSAAVIGNKTVICSGFYQLLNNYANERLLAFQNATFQGDRVLDFYEREQIPIHPLVKYGNPISHSHSSENELVTRMISSSGGVDGFGILDIVEYYCAKTNTSLPTPTGKDSQVNPNHQVTQQIYEEFQSNTTLSKLFFTNSKKPLEKFSIKHFAGVVDYDTTNWMQSNIELLSTDAVLLFRGTRDMAATSNDFIRSMFSNRAISSMANPRYASSIILSIPNHSKDVPVSNAVKNVNNDQETLVKTISGNFRKSLDELLDSCRDKKPWFIIHLKPSDETSQGVDSDTLKRQIAQYDLVALSVTPSTIYTVHFGYSEFYEKYKSVLPTVDANNQAIFQQNAPAMIKQDCQKMIEKYKWKAESNAVLGVSKIFLTESTWRSLDDQLRNLEEKAYQIEKDSIQQQQQHHELTNEEILNGTSEPNSLNNSRATTPVIARKRYASVLAQDEANSSAYSGTEDGTEGESTAGDGSYYGPGFIPSNKEEVIHSPTTIDTQLLRNRSNKLSKTTDVERSPNAIQAPAIEGNTKKGKKIKPPKIKKEHKPKTKTRVAWECMSWCLTFYIFNFCLRVCGKMKRKDIQMAWREKVALNIIIFFMCCTMLFYIIGLGMIICPKQNVLSEGEIAAKNTLTNPYVVIYGDYYKVDSIITDHVTANQYLNELEFKDTVLGRDVSPMFDKTTVWNNYCSGLHQPSGWKNSIQQAPMGNGFRWYPHQRSTIVNGASVYYDYIKGMSGIKKGQVARNQDWIKQYLAADLRNNKLIVAFDKVYDISKYCYQNICVDFLGENIVQVFQKFGSSGDDVTSYMEQVKKIEGKAKFDQYMKCMDWLFMVGVVDHRLDASCLFSNYILLASSIILISIIGFKFIAAVRLTSSRIPEHHEKFVILQVPCYTEGVESLRKTFESLAMTDYEDKRKLLFVVADGMIIGSGNDKPTPRIVLDILGVPDNLDPESKDYIALGEGTKQHNMGKVYSGLYEVNGRRIPYVVIVKVGKPSERSRPGNRGKRDSQLVLMQFLSRVHFEQPMNPLELEIYHHMKNIIGVTPSLYEYILMVDADTEVMKQSLNRMIAVMIKDSKIMGLCGETLISNEGDTWVTMMQVYEYFISHHMAKAFESLFGAVTCLPGCFCMYRIKSSSGEVPLLISPAILKEYSQNTVETLHMKNLLHLGEDRYLTTLMLKNFPNLKLSFTADAKCKTNVPDRWDVFLSQRRRWINSTIHNLFELLMVPQLCGFCLFSMRFVIFVDLFATLVQPAALVYVGFLIWSSLQPDAIFPLFSLIMLAVIYGLQVVIIIFMKEWQNLAWLVFYILALPFWAFYLPLYAFWHFDDFSWGNTRVVLGETGKKIYEAEAEDFDPKKIIKEIKWAEYEEELIAASIKEKSQTESSTASEKAPKTAESAYSQRQLPNRAYTSSNPPSLPHSPQSFPGNWAVASTTSSSRYQNGKYRTDSIGSIPSDPELIIDLRQILSVANPMLITKKQIREQLAIKHGGIDLSVKKEFISKTIDQILKGQL